MRAQRCRQIHHHSFPMCLDGGRLAYLNTSGRRGGVFVCGVLAFPKFTPYGQVCLPYLDPALIQSRQQILRSVYGFACACPSCIFVQDIGMVPEPPKTSTLRAKMEGELRRYVFPNGPLRDLATIHRFNLKKESFPQALHPVLQEPYIADLSERFSRASHEGQAVVALETGLTLLALYVLIYPKNYPQIGKGTSLLPSVLPLSQTKPGIHLLEMAKTAWNATMSPGPSDETESAMLRDCQAYLLSGQRILTIFGAEGDKGGPLDEIRALQDLLATADSRHIVSRNIDA